MMEKENDFAYLLICLLAYCQCLAGRGRVEKGAGWLTGHAAESLPDSGRRTLNPGNTTLLITLLPYWLQM